MIALVALSAVLAADGTRAAGEDADARRDWPAALAAWRTCARTAPDRDARYCATRAATLAPHEADGFAGWGVLEGVRRDYRALGSDAAVARIEAALATAPDSPAAPAMRLWLANERGRRGEQAAVADIGREMAADTRSEPAAVRFVEDMTARDVLDGRRRAGGLAGAALAGAYVVTALLRRGPWRWRSALLAGAVLGGVPAAFAALYEDGVSDGFARSGLVVSVAVLLAGRAPWWVAVPGTVGGLAAMAWANGWYPSLGL